MKTQTIILTRFFAFILLTFGALLLVRNLILSYESFNPSYIGHFFKQELLSPTLLITAGFLVRASAKKIANWIHKGLAE